MDREANGKQLEAARERLRRLLDAEHALLAQVAEILQAARARKELCRDADVLAAARAGDRKYKRPFEDPRTGALWQLEVLSVDPAPARAEGSAQ